MSTHTTRQLCQQRLSRTLLLLPILVLSLLCSCHKQQRYHISGYTDAQEGADPPLLKLTLDGKTIDSCFVYEGEFHLKGNYVDSMSQDIAYLEITGEPPIPIVLSTQPLAIDFIKRRLIEGDYLNQELDRLYVSLDSLGGDFKQNLAAIPPDSALYDAFDQGFKSAIDNYTALAKDYCLRHPNDPVGIIASVMLLTINYESLLETAPFVRSHMGPLVLKNKEIDLYLSTVDNFYRTAPGTPIIDLPLETLEGDTTYLSKQLLPGCYTLLHCWAGWCKPCLDEMPNLIKAYKIYHERGLNMVGIFLWDEPYNLKMLQAEYQLQWPQLYEPTARTSITYGIYSIPEIMLIAPDGTIAARSLRGAELFDTLESIYR
ncbi:TlpA family protein disulfide reductase [Porphyromonas uenonis]|uniref:TlpA family protein disulfide reductase n=1 Tax=Porphyromonas uenonis TaxID=281920 RepID=UPI0004819395|nr:TlpA disulfide reductase family protein [Porphyromonas uenonis]